MATSTTGARASRRSAARQAADAPVPTVTAAADALPYDLSDPSAETDEAFGPETLAGGSDRAANTVQASQVQNATIAAVRPASSQHRVMALPMEDLTRKVDASDLIMPKLRLSQAMSKTNTLFSTSKGSDGVGMGSWYVSSSGKNLGEQVFFVPVDMRKSRAMFVQGQGLMCRSFDLLQGEGDPGISCEGSYEERLTIPAEHRGCPLRLWNDKQPPKCGVTYNFPGYVIEDITDPATMTQVILQLRSASTQAAKAINTFVLNEGGGVWQQVILELGVETKSNMKGTFFVPTVDFYDTTDAPEFARVKRRADAMARQMGSQALRASLEDDAE